MSRSVDRTGGLGVVMLGNMEGTACMCVVCKERERVLSDGI